LFHSVLISFGLLIYLGVKKDYEVVTIFSVAFGLLWMCFGLVMTIEHPIEIEEISTTPIVTKTPKQVIVEWYDDKFTVTALPVEGFDCKYQSLRLDFEYTSNG
jgi:hypothetical protein